MKKMLIISMSTAYVLLVTANAQARPQCQLLVDEKKPDQYSVISSSGEKLGYIALESDGSWFAWLKNKGAMNRAFATQESAIEGICLPSVE